MKHGGKRNRRFLRRLKMRQAERNRIVAGRKAMRRKERQMLKEIGLYGEIDKVARAMARLRLHEPPEGYYVAFSGGKDSCVVPDCGWMRRMCEVNVYDKADIRCLLWEQNVLV